MMITTIPLEIFFMYFKITIYVKKKQQQQKNTTLLPTKQNHTNIYLLSIFDYIDYILM
jgi:hypothetical protein